MNPPSKAALKCPMRSIADVAQHLGLSQKTVRRLMANGELAYHKIGGQIRISADYLEAFLKERRIVG